MRTHWFQMVTQSAAIQFLVCLNQTVNWVSMFTANTTPHWATVMVLARLKKAVQIVPTQLEEEVMNIDYRQQSLIKLDSETHSGEDVAIFARGPQAYLFQGSWAKLHLPRNEWSLGLNKVIILFFISKLHQATFLKPRRWFFVLKDNCD